MSLNNNRPNNTSNNDSDKNIKLLKPKIKNPKINYFNINSHFIYDLSKPKQFILEYPNKNLMKLSDSERDILLKQINEINLSFETYDTTNQILITEATAISINKFFKRKVRETEIISWIKEKINNNPSRQQISCRKLSRLFFDENRKIVSKNYINLVLKNKIGLKYLKTKVKNIKVIEDNQNFMKICFIKIIARAIKLGYHILFMDETSILSSNNNYRCWRHKNEPIYYKLNPPKRVNLLLTVNLSSVVYYKINEDNTNEVEFLKYMNELFEKIKSQKINKYLIVLDNLSSHKTPNVLKFFVDNKINILFNVTYVSEFNNVELCFRYLKRNIYSNLYTSISDTIKDVKRLLEELKISDVLLKNYRSNIRKYISFSDNI